MSTQQQPAQRQRRETPEEEAARWRKWRNIAIFTVAGLVLAYDAWIYLWPMLYVRLFQPRLPAEVALEDVVADFNDDAVAVARKYDKKRIVVVGKLIVEPKTRLIYFQLPGDKGEELRVPVEFFDVDDAGSVDPGDQVTLSGVLKWDGPGKFRLVGAAQMPTGQ